MTNHSTDPPIHPLTYQTAGGPAPLASTSEANELADSGVARLLKPHETAQLAPFQPILQTAHRDSMTNHRATSSIHPLTPWTAADFAPLATMSGAHKLAASGVAPLVALARGYETLENAQVADFAKNHGLGNRNSRQHTQVLNATRDSDAMVIPWFRADIVAEAHKAGRIPSPTTMQLRRAQSRENAVTGKMVKYENLAGSESVIDTNPGTPPEWFARSPKLLITEGVIKGDSALTAQLRANNIPDEMLAEIRGMTPSVAVAKLRDLMMTIPEKNRVTIISFVGVGNWKGNDVWTSLALRDRQLLLAFDGDIDSNWNVWSQAFNLWHFAAGKNAQLRLVDLSVDTDGEYIEMAATNSAKPDKVGIDDFLARHGDWNDILTRLRDELPIAPDKARNDVEVGTWGVSEDGTTVQEFLAGPPNAAGQPGPAYWKVQYNIGGRVASVDTHRAPTDVEVETGVFGEGIDHTEATRDTCRIELKWIQSDGTPANAVVTGPATLLMYPPSEWDKRKAVLPKNLLLHDEWPPRKGYEWLAAIKANDRIPTEQRVSWTTMGWVPVENSTVCSFISGRTVISPNDKDRERTVAGVSESVLPGSSKFSLPETNLEVMSDAWQQQVREDLDALYKHYITNRPWTNENIAAVILAAGLRPTIPIRCSTNLYVQGPPGQGKSWSVAQILSFHQARKTWNNKHLPGSMKDTGTSVEQALAQTNIWVMDDLAPSPDKRQNDAEQSKIGDIMRSVHNGTSKRRSGTDLQAREMFTPRALMITTAENEHTINSVRDRAVILNLDKSSLRDDQVEIMNEFRDDNRAPGRITRASVEAIQYLAVEHGWDVMLAHVGEIRKSFAESAKKVIAEVKVEGKSDARHVDMAVDLSLGLASIALLAELVEHQDFLDMFSEDTKNNLPDRVARVLAAAFQSQGESTPGRAFTDALRDALAAGKAHILHGKSLSAPFPDDAPLNRLLGWQNDLHGSPRPLGAPIGYLVAATATATTMDLIALEEKSAFTIAQYQNRAAFPPGSTAKGVYTSFWAEGLAHPDHPKAPAEGRSGKRFRVGGRFKRLVPVHLDRLIGAAETAGQV